ncbi:MAG: toll/interleukin-1 receptor domain-containing protein [Vitreimonas sp.]
MGKVFISYAHEDHALAQRVCERLEALGFQPWIDRQAPAAKDDISTVIDGQIGQVAAVLVLWSERSRASVWVRGEALRGLEGDKYFGALLAPVVPPVPFNAMAAPDLSDWSGLQGHQGWSALVRGLAELAPSQRESILNLLGEQQAAERVEAERKAEAQAQLPLEVDPHEEPREELDEGPHYIDVDYIIASARALISSAGKLDLATALTQATLDQEMLRDAAFVVSTRADLPRPAGANYLKVSTIAEALDKAKPNQLIVLDEGERHESIRISKPVRIVGLGSAAKRATIRGTKRGPAVGFGESARIENVTIETREAHHAVHCERGQPVLLKCDVRRFSNARNEYDSALHVAAKANPILIASSVTATGCAGVWFVANSGGTFVGGDVITMRGRAIVCRGRPKLIGTHVEAIGAHAVEVPAAGAPEFEECEILGRGAPVVSVSGYARPRISKSRVSAIRQLAFDFEGHASGHYEENVVAVESDAQAGTTKPDWTRVFGRLKSKQDAIVENSNRARQFVRVRGSSRPIFVSNITSDGALLEDPGSYRYF